MVAKKKPAEQTRKKGPAGRAGSRNIRKKKNDRTLTKSSVMAPGGGEREKQKLGWE